MYRIRKSIDIDFSHHVHGHMGPCINVHGHTWKFEVGLEATELTPEGFVVDFKHLKNRVLKPSAQLLDHALAVGQVTYQRIEGDLAELGAKLLATRADGGAGEPKPELELAGAMNCYPGGMKVAVFPFIPTSERLAEWLWRLADSELNDGRVAVSYGRIYETLHPVESVAEYAP
ncbi:MAG: 6-carboxytetrahydropterin synthase [Myxococcota bacterium]